MMSGHALAASARAAGGESQLAPALGIVSWVVAGIAAVIIDRTIPVRFVGAASVVLPLIWFATLLAKDGNPLWPAAGAAIMLFGLLAGLSAGATHWLLRRMPGR
ncbi:MAG: hypothetical protein WD690_13730 [Vicinamibacterales bacterium]